MSPVLPITKIKREFIGADDWEALKSSAGAKNILAATTFAAEYHEPEENFLINQVALLPLGNVSHEVWTVDEPVSSQVTSEVEIATVGDISFVSIVVDENDVTGHGSPLAAAGYQAYKRLFEVIKTHDLGNMVRVWNYVPKILKMTDDKVPQEDRERYRQFNAGRADAWNDFGPRAASFLLRPAATGIGSRGGPLVLQCVASKHKIIYIENPRQVPAYHYPAKFGTKAPAFARGTLHLIPGHPELYVAGTASIVGSETTNIGDAKAQVAETFANIQALISGKNLGDHHDGFQLRDLTNIRVYVKNPEQYPLIKTEVESVLKPSQGIIYLNDDICRPDLLLEIEAVAVK